MKKYKSIYNNIRLMFKKDIECISMINYCKSSYELPLPINLAIRGLNFNYFKFLIDNGAKLQLDEEDIYNLNILYKNIIIV